MDASQHHTPLSDILDSIDLPNPTSPVPFERFAHLKESPDMLQRAAFWAFYVAWQMDTSGVAGENAATLTVEARHDGYTFHAISQQLHIRDCVLIRLNELDTLYARANRRADIGISTLGCMMAVGAVLGFLMCVVLGLIGYGL